jgi:ubiquinol-cytochrome c reductase cytochrome c1 subunit
MKTILKGLAAFGIALGSTAATQAAEYPLKKPVPQEWTFSGPFGSYDKGQLQRGLMIYRESCSSCHSMQLVAFRNLEALGYSPEQVRALAAEYEIQDGPNADGDMFTRPGIPSDRFPSPYPNPETAAVSNNGAVPPDFSLIAKARAVERGFPTFLFDIFTQYAESGPDYIYNLLTGYEEDVPENVDVQPGTYYNPHFMSGAVLSMAQPIFDEQFTYQDGTPETLDQYARDVTAFLMWAAEPHLETRKRMGFNVMVFLALFGALVYLTKRKVWSNIEH